MSNIKRILLIIILIILLPDVFATQDRSDFEIYAYKISPESEIPEGSVYIEIGNAMTGSVLDSDSIDISNNIENMLADLDSIGTINEHDHPEEIVFSYLVHGYEFTIPAGGYNNQQKSNSFTIDVSVSPFTNGTDTIDAAFRIVNTSATFASGPRINNIGTCSGHALVGDTTTTINAEIVSTATNGHVKAGEKISQDLYVSYTKCESNLGWIGSHKFNRNSNVSSEPWSVRGAVSIIFDEEDYKNVPNGTYVSNVTLTIKPTA